MNRDKNIPDLEKIIKYMGKFIKNLSSKGLYILFLLYYAFKDKATPKWAKNIIVGSIAYFLSPIDSIPDLTPFIGMTDDLGVLSFGLVTVACYVNMEVREKSLLAVKKIFKSEISEEVIAEVDSWL